MRTVNAALSKVSAGGAVVVRGGEYHQSISVPDRRTNVTIQAYPKEAVWFDGSVPVTGWTQSGSTWYCSGWDTTFDANASFSRGSNDPSFINPSYPMAGHPDQVWVSGTAQQQVSSVSQVHSGTFYVDYSAHRIYLGTDPSGREVRSSDTIRGFYSAAANTTLRGIGFHRYAPSVADLASLRITGANSIVENVVSDDNANGGISIGGPNVTVRNVSADRNGLVGFLANSADNLTLTSSLVSANNTEHYNRNPVSGGLKITRSRTVTITDSTSENNVTNGLWLDESVYDAKVINNRIIANGYYGIEAELGTKVVIAGNVVARNANNGIMVFDTSNVQVWNNTLVSNGRDFEAYQDSRTETNTGTPGHDPRRPNPDPTMSWLVGGPLVFKNNVVVSTGSDYLVVVQDGTIARNWQQIGFQSDSNVYQRGSANTALLTSGGRNVTYTTLSNLQAATGGDGNSREVGGGAVSGSYAVTSVVTTLAPSSATGLPSDIAALLHTDAGTRVLGSLQR